MSTATRTFRGSSLDEILPRIRAELGPDAVITRRREGLAGGIAGFFQKQFVEVEAHAGGRRVDLLDDSDALPPSLARVPSAQSPVPGTDSQAIQKIRQQAAPFADELSTALEQAEPILGTGHWALGTSRALGTSTALGTAAAPLVAARRTPIESPEIVSDLVAAGLHPALAEGIVTETVSHLMPFSPHLSLDRLVRETLARRIPVQSTWTRRGRTIAFVGPGGSGKTMCTARLAAAYADGSDLPVICLTLRPLDGGATLRALLEPHGVAVHAIDDPGEARARIAGAREHALIVIDTPGLSPAAPAEVQRLADELGRIGVYEIHLALPATMGAHAADDIMRGLAPLGISRIALTHADETGHVGPAIGLAIRSGSPLSYISSGSGVAGAILPVNPQALASIILP